MLQQVICIVNNYIPSVMTLFGGRLIHFVVLATEVRGMKVCSFAFLRSVLWVEGHNDTVVTAKVKA